MTEVTSGTLQSKPLSELLLPDTKPVQHFTSQASYREDLAERYLLISYAALVHSVFGPPPDISEMRQRLKKDGVLEVGSNGTEQWSGLVTPAPSGRSESVAFRPFIRIISTIFTHIPNCKLFCVDNPSMEPLSACANMSQSDAYIVLGCPTAKEMHWFDIVIPFEFRAVDDSQERDDSDELPKIIWSLHDIMRKDPLRRFAMGIMIEDTKLTLLYNNRAFLAVSEPLDFTTSIDEIISLFCRIGNMSKEELGWGPTVERITVEDKTQFKFTIGNEQFTTTRLLATYGADAMVGRGTRVYEARDEQGNTVAIKDSWRDEDRTSVGTIQKTIVEDIWAKLGEQEAAKTEKYFVKHRICEDVIISGKPDTTFKLRKDESDERPTEVTRGEVLPPTMDTPCMLHTRTVFEDVGTPLMEVNCLEDAISCLSDSLRALYCTHKAGWVHRDFSVANVIGVEKDGKYIGKLGDFEYGQQVDSTASHDIRTGTMYFMAVEVENQMYIFKPRKVPRGHRPPFRMNFLHDLESHWWAAMWILLAHTDADSPPQNPMAQWNCLQKAFPGVIGQVARYAFFAEDDLHTIALETLSTTYGEKYVTIFDLANDLYQSYTTAEAPFPNLLLDDDLLDDIHNKMSKGYSDALQQLKGSNIRLRPIWRGTKRDERTDIDDSRTAKRARQGE